MPRAGETRAGETPAPQLAAGALAWAAFCVAVVAARGVRWDETYEFAQVILGIVRHPEGHPLIPYVRNAYSLQVYTSAALLWATGSALAVNAFRNFLFIGATVFPAYLLGAKLSGRALYGHAAALLILAGVHLELHSTYPQFVWPDIFSNGHIGTAWALLTVWCLASSRWRAGYLLLGLMPCIHVGQAPPVLMVAGSLSLALAITGRWRELSRRLGFFGIGLAICGLFWIVQRPFIMPAAATGAYAATGDVDSIWRHFVAYHDIHRAWPPLNGQVGLALLLVLSGLMMRTVRLRRGAEEQDDPAWPVILVYSIAIGGLVWHTMAAQAFKGLETPRVLLQWMPYRLLNHAPPLLVAAACGILGRDKRGGLVVLATLVAAVAIPYTRPAWPAELYARYLAPNAGLIFLLVGAALFRAATGAFANRNLAVGAALVVSVAVAAFHQYGAVLLAAGAVLGFVITLPRRSDRPCEQTLSRVAALVVVAAGAVLLHQQLIQRQVLPVGGFEQSVRSYLAARGEDGAMLAGPPKQLLLQAKTHHPVITDMALPYMITYLPSIGPSVSKLYEDVYGIRLTDKGEADWQTFWEERPREAWLLLAEKYSFRYVIAPGNLHLNLRKVLATKSDALYAVE